MSDRVVRELERAVQAGEPRAEARLLHLLARTNDSRLIAAAKLRQRLRRWLFQAQAEGDFSSKVIRFATLAEVLHEGLEVQLTPNATFAFRRLVADDYDGVGLFCSCLDGSLVRIGLRGGGGGKTLASYWPDEVASWAGKAATREAKLRGLEGAPNVIDLQRSLVEDLLRFEGWAEPDDYGVWLELCPEADAEPEQVPESEGPSKSALKKLDRLRKAHNLDDASVRGVAWELTGRLACADLRRNQFNAVLKELERLATSSGEGEEEVRIARGLAAERKRLLKEPKLSRAVEALTTRGGGRICALQEAVAEGAFEDERLLPLAVLGLSDPITDLGRLLARQVLPAYGAAAVPLLLAGFDPLGEQSHGQRLLALRLIDPSQARTLAREALQGEGASGPVSLAAIRVLADDPVSLDLIRGQVQSTQAKVREEARRVLGANAGEEDRAASFREALRTKDIKQAPELLRSDTHGTLGPVLIEEAYLQLGLFSGQRVDPELKKTRSRGAAHFVRLLGCVSALGPLEEQAFLLACWKERAKLRGLSKKKGEELFLRLVIRLSDTGGEEAVEALLSAREEIPAEAVGVVFSSAARVLSSEALYDTFASSLEEGLGREDLAALEIETILSGRSRPDPLDPRWLDLAVAKRHARLSSTLIRPGHSQAVALLTEIATSDDTRRRDLPTMWQDRAPQMHALEALALVDAPTLEDVAIAVARKVLEGNAPDHWLTSFKLWLPGRLAPALKALLPEFDNDLSLAAVCKRISGRKSYRRRGC